MILLLPFCLSQTTTLKKPTRALIYHGVLLATLLLPVSLRVFFFFFFERCAISLHRLFVPARRNTSTKTETGTKSTDIVPKKILVCQRYLKEEGTISSRKANRVLSSLTRCVVRSLPHSGVSNLYLLRYHLVYTYYFPQYSLLLRF